jgi:transposase-like protein
MQKDLREVYWAPNRVCAEAAINVFAEKYALKHSKAVECLTKDRETLLAFYDFPAEHWDHLRTTSPIESVFATVRHRTVRTKGSLSSRISDRRARAHRLRTHQDQPARRAPAVALEGSASSRGR